MAAVVLSRGRFTRGEIEELLNSSFGRVCAIILITGAGGMFGGVLRDSGIGAALADSLDGLGLPVIVGAGRGARRHRDRLRCHGALARQRLGVLARGPLPQDGRRHHPAHLDGDGDP